jgi:outer membrane protein OmpA-like peptidoglycan-associated protein
LKLNGETYWATITHRSPKEYVVRLVEEKDMTVKFSSKVKMDLTQDSFVFRGLKFDSGKFVLKETKSSKDDLNKIEMLLVKFPSLLIEIQGHTDNKGNANKNKILSQKRADAIKEALVERGIEESRLKTKGFGSEKLIPKASDEENRRVEILKLEGGDVSVDIKQFTELSGYSKKVNVLAGGKSIRAHYHLEGTKGSNVKEILKHYEAIVGRLGGKVLSKSDNKLSFDFDGKISGKLTVFKEDYYVSLNYEKGEK